MIVACLSIVLVVGFLVSFLYVAFALNLQDRDYFHGISDQMDYDSWIEDL